MMLHTTPLGVVNVLISKVLHVSVIAPCVEEPVRTEVAHDLEDGHAAVLDLRRIGLPGLGPPLPRCGSWCSAWSSCEDSCRSHSDGTFEPALGCGVRSLEVTVELGVGAREGPVGGVSGHVGGSHRSRSHEALHVAHTTAGGCGGMTIHEEGSAPLLRASSAGARSQSTFEASFARSTSSSFKRFVGASSSFGRRCERDDNRDEDHPSLSMPSPLLLPRQEVRARR